MCLISMSIPLFRSTEGALVHLQAFGGLDGSAETWLSHCHAVTSQLGISESDTVKTLRASEVTSKTWSKTIVGQWLRLFRAYFSQLHHFLKKHRLSVEASHTLHQPKTNSLSGATLEDTIRAEIAKQTLIPEKEGRLCSGMSPSLARSIISFVNNFYHLPLSTEQLALALGFEPSFFAKAFKNIAGTSMIAYLRHVRLQQAKQLLANPFLSMQEISRRTGFSDPSYFTKVFRKKTGKTPRQFREHILQK